MNRRLLARSCSTMDVHRRLLNSDPSYRANRSNIETMTLRHKNGGGRHRDAITLIPVVVHVVFNELDQDISTEQVTSQITSLTRDFRRQNPDIDSLPEVWRSLAADTRIEFVLANRDPKGRPHDGINRRQTAVTRFSDDDSVKFEAKGGLNAWPSDRYLNLWVCPMSELLGYAQFPGGPAETDGVVINHEAFGAGIGTAAPPFDLGRTATHEVGHWLNLLHIWGDDGMGCAGTDFVDDTPNQAGPNIGQPAFPSISCDNGPNGDMFVNFMDYTDDGGMVMFSHGQVSRMHASLAGPRASFPTTDGPLPQPVQSVGSWLHTDLTLAAGAPDAEGDPVLGVAADGTVRVLYRGVDSHIHELRSNS